MASVEAEATHASHHTLEYGGWDDCAVRCGQWILTSSENTGGVERGQPHSLVNIGAMMYYASEFPNAMLQGSVSYGMCHISLTAYIGGSSSVLLASK